MTLGKPPSDEPALLRHLIEQGGRVRPLADRERRSLLARIEASLEARRRGGVRRLVVPVAAMAGVALAAVHWAQPVVEGTGSSVAATPVPSSSTAHAPGLASQAPARTALAALAQPQASSRVIALGGRGEIVLEQGALATLPPDVLAGGTHPVRVALQRGTLRASVRPRAPHEPLSILTPQLLVTVVGTRFSVQVDAELTTVSVEHGLVRVERTGSSVLVAGGESVRSDDERFARPARSQSRRSGPEHCSVPAKHAADRACLARQAQGSGLAAENALLALALLERDQLDDSSAALARLRQYERRFPSGRLRQEVALATVRTLQQRDSRSEACAYAADYARRFPADAATSRRLGAGCEPP
jgi:FecR protein